MFILAEMKYFIINCLLPQFFVVRPLIFDLYSSLVTNYHLQMMAEVAFCF